MIKANEARAKVQAHKDEQVAKAKAYAEKWIEHSVTYDIDYLSMRGETTANYKVDTCVFTDEVTKAVVEILEAAGYEVECEKVSGGYLSISIDW